MKTNILIILFSAFLSTALIPNHGDIKNRIQRYMGWGDADQVCYLMEDQVKLELLNKAETLTVDIAKERMKSFFLEYPASGCSILRQGKYVNDTRYFEGLYITKKQDTLSAYFEAELDQDEGHYHLSLIRVE